jgi:hypothetical protein
MNLPGRKQKSSSRMQRTIRTLLSSALVCSTVQAFAAPPEKQFSQPENALILTPPAPATPRINGPDIFGVRPGWHLTPLPVASPENSPVSANIP